MFYRCLQICIGLFAAASAFAQGTIQGTIAFYCSGPEGGSNGFGGFVQLINAQDLSVVMSQQFGQVGPYYYSFYPYQFTNVPDGQYFVRTYQVRASPGGAGCMDEVYPDVHYFSPTDYQNATAIVVENGGSVANLNLDVDTLILVRGLVSTTANGVVGPVEVVLFTEDGVELTRSSAILNANSNGASGYFVLAAPIGAYRIGVRNSIGLVDANYGGQYCVAGNCDVSSSNSFQVQSIPPWSVSDIDFLLVKGGTISGNVRDNDGAAIEGAVVRFLDSERDLVLEVTTDVDGNYVATSALPDGDYYVEASKVGYYSELFNNSVCVDSCEGQSGTIVIISNAANVENINFSITSTDRPIPLPNLVGKVVGARRDRNYVVGGVRVSNVGASDSAAFSFKVFAARSPERVEGRRLVKVGRIRELASGRSKLISFRGNLSSRYRWILLDIDPSHIVYESSDNNTAIRKIR